MTDERGFTVIELVVACAIGLVVVAGSVSVLLGAQRRSSAVERRTEAMQRARMAVDTAQRSLRAQACLTRTADAPLPPIVAATPTAVTFYADLGGTGAPRLRKLELSGGTFTETVWPDATGTGTPLVRRLATGVASVGSGVPTFAYFAYDTATPPQPDTPLTATSGLSDTDRQRVAAIRIRLAATATVAGVKPIEVQNRVLVRLTDPDGSVMPLCV